MLDTARFEFMANELTRAFATLGLKALPREPPYGSVLTAELAEWSRDKPVISIWYGDWFTEQKNEHSFWVGFQGKASKIRALLNEIQSRSLYQATKFETFDYSNWSITNIPADDSKIACELDINAHYIGFYEASITTSSDTELAKKFAMLIFKIIENVESPELVDLKEIAEARKQGLIDETSYQRLVQARRGQGRFRSELDEFWENRCAASKCEIYQSLRASHIRPWRASDNQQRLDRDNGILLNAFIDSLFDKGLVSFDDSGNILISDELSAHEIEFFRLKEMSLSKTPSRKQKEYLKYHREKLGKNLG